jgi:sulfur transfer protein SufE
MNISEFSKRAEAYQLAFSLARIKVEEIIDKFPPCADPGQRVREFLEIADHLALDPKHTEEAHYLRQLCVLMEELYWLKRPQRDETKSTSRYDNSIEEVTPDLT